MLLLVSLLALVWDEMLEHMRIAVNGVNGQEKVHAKASSPTSWDSNLESRCRHKSIALSALCKVGKGEQ